MSNNTIIEKEYYDAASGELIRVQKQICHRCKQPIGLAGTGHNECRRAFLEEEAAQLEKRRQKECIIKFRRVVSRQEEQWMTYPDSKIMGYSETYNQYLKRIAREKEQAHFKKLADRVDRRERQLPDAIRRLDSLKAQVARDELEATEEAKHKEEAGVAAVRHVNT